MFIKENKAAADARTEAVCGWTNIETYTVAGLIDNDEDIYGQTQNIISYYKDLPKPLAIAEIATCLKTIVLTNVKAEEGMTKDLLACAIARINFEELAETWLKDYKEGKNE